MVNVEETPKVRIRVRRRRSRRRTRKLRMFTGVLLLVLVVGSVFPLIGHEGYVHYQMDTSLAHTAISHLQKVETLLVKLPQNPFDASKVNEAQYEFAAALAPLVQLKNDLQWLPAASTSIPVYGTRLNALLHLVPLAIALSQAGETSCALLNVIISRFQNPFDSKAQGLTLGDLKVISLDLSNIEVALNVVRNEANQIQPEDLQFDPRVDKLVSILIKNLPMIQQWLTDATQLLAVAPTLLGIGTPTNYLIEVLDATELRPEGGFIGNYGIATLSGGRLTKASITDVELLDRPFEAAGNVIPFPPGYRWFDLVSGWSLRDAGLDADFPTVARYSEQNYEREGGNIPVQGVIAITPTLIQHALLITGPIRVPEFQETINAQNLIARIHYHQLGGVIAHEGSSTIPSSDGYSSQRKRFTALLAEHFLSRIHQLAPTSLAKLLQLLVASVRTKDIQIYLNRSAGENLLQRYHIDASIQPTVDDGIFVVDANIAANKANSFITSRLEDQVTIDTQGNATHQTTLRYAWMQTGSIYGRSLYRDYVRVYVPDGSLLESADGWQARGTNESFGHEVWAGFFTLIRGQTRTITLTWIVHHAAKSNSNGWHYQYLIQRQAGTQWALYLQVRLPICATQINTWGAHVLYRKQIASLSQILNEDVNLEMDYICQ